ncbi:membrane protein [Nocardioidaceae bacterium Broad-1]|nr:membrane protein [Nocardioidaceae bacterium Broad-1]
MATSNYEGNEIDGGGPDEGPEQRITRNWNELLQELRVLQTGVQILTGFLLTVPFSPRFPDLNDHQQTIYLVVLVGSVITTSLIIAPVSFHRMLFRRRQRPWLVTASHICARAGLVGFAIVSALVVLLVFDVVVSLEAALVAAAAVLVLFISLWAGLPLVNGRNNSH